MILCSGMASSASREELEEMYFRKQIKAGENKEGVKCEITRERKKQIKRKLTLEWCVSLVGCCPP
jgi:hypothetical protein